MGCAEIYASCTNQFPIYIVSRHTSTSVCYFKIIHRTHLKSFYNRWGEKKIIVSNEHAIRLDFSISMEKAHLVWFFLLLLSVFYMCLCYILKLMVHIHVSGMQTKTHHHPVILIAQHTIVNITVHSGIVLRWCSRCVPPKTTTILVRSIFLFFCFSEEFCN